MFIRREPDGTLLVPVVAEGEGGLTGDAVAVVPPGDPEYADALAAYEREQALLS